MTEDKKFFSADAVDARIRELQKRIQLIPEGLDSNPKASYLAMVIGIFVSNAKLVDEHCQLNIGWLRSEMSVRLQATTAPDSNAIDAWLAIFYRLVVEFDISTKDDLSFELRQFKNFLENEAEKLSAQVVESVRYAQVGMPVAILKELLNKSEVIKIRDVAGVAATIDAKHKQWDSEFLRHESAADKLRLSLQSYETGFNFVGLYDGFKLLATQKTSELSSARYAMKWLGGLCVCPLLIELIILLAFNKQMSVFPPYLIVSASIIFLSITFICLYFFRLSIRSVDAIKAQLLQLDLRKTLCQFIQSYAEYSKNSDPAAKDTLSIFEGIIFSGIVSTEEKIPSTFDGIEQISGIIKSIKGG